MFFLSLHKKIIRNGNIASLTLLFPRRSSYSITNARHSCEQRWCGTPSHLHGVRLLLPVDGRRRESRASAGAVSAPARPQGCGANAPVRQPDWRAMARGRAQGVSRTVRRCIRSCAPSDGGHTAAAALPRHPHPRAYHNCPLARGVHDGARVRDAGGGDGVPRGLHGALQLRLLGQRRHPPQQALSLRTLTG